MNAQTRIRLSWGATTLALGAMLLLPARASQADVTVVVSVVSAPQKVVIGQTFTVDFAANVTGKTNDGKECEVRKLSETWTYTITGSNGGTITGTGSTVHHTASSLQTYTVTGKCVVSYETGTECGGNGSGEDDDSASVLTIPKPCPEPPK